MTDVAKLPGSADKTPAQMQAQTQGHTQGLTQAMVDLIAGMVKALVDHPEAVQVEVHSEAEGTALMLRVAPADLGKVIGKQGRTARSMRTILGAASMKAQHRFSLDIQQAGRPESPETPSSPDDL